MKSLPDSRRRPRSLCAAARHVYLLLESLEDRNLPSTMKVGPVFDALTVRRGEYAESRVLLRMQPGAACPAMESGAGQALVPGLCQIDLAPGLSVRQALAAYERDARVLSAQPDYRVQLTGTPNDPQFSSQWALQNTGQVAGKPGYGNAGRTFAALRISVSSSARSKGSMRRLVSMGARRGTKGSCHTFRPCVRCSMNTGGNRDIALRSACGTRRPASRARPCRTSASSGAWPSAPTGRGC